MNGTCVSRCAGRMAVLIVSWLTLGPVADAQQTRTVTPLNARVSGAIVARDLALFDSLTMAYAEDRSPIAIARAQVMSATNEQSLMLRSRAYVDLARAAYERNDPGTLADQLLAVATTRVPVPRTRRPELWALVDSLSAVQFGQSNFQESLVSLEVALVRSQYPILGAPDCAVWDTEAVRLAQLMRAMTPPPVVAAVTPPEIPRPPAPTPVIAPPIKAVTAAAPAQLHGIPSMVHFALDKSYLAPASRAVLDVLVDSLRRFPDVNVVLEGHTDLRASVAYNLALSRRRTMSVRSYLLAKGIPDARISIVAQGKSHLQSDGVGVTDHARNRRVQLRYFAPDGREIEAMQLLDDLQLEAGRARATTRPPTRPRRP